MSREVNHRLVSMLNQQQRLLAESTLIHKLETDQNNPVQASQAAAAAVENADTLQDVADNLAAMKLKPESSGSMRDWINNTLCDICFGPSGDAVPQEAPPARAGRTSPRWLLAESAGTPRSSRAVEAARREHEQIVDRICNQHQQPMVRISVPNHVLPPGNNVDSARRFQCVIELPKLKKSGSEQPTLADSDLAKAIKFHFHLTTPSAKEVEARIASERDSFKTDNAHHLMQKREFVLSNRESLETTSAQLQSCIENAFHDDTESEEESSDESTDDSEESESSSESSGDGRLHAKWSPPPSLGTVQPGRRETRRGRGGGEKIFTSQNPTVKKDTPLSEYIDPEGYDSVAWGHGLKSSFANDVEIVSRKQSFCHPCGACRSITFSICKYVIATATRLCSRACR